MSRSRLQYTDDLLYYQYMTNVEHTELYGGFQWAEPFQKNGELEVQLLGSKLHITGLLPRYKSEGRPSDVIWQYERAPKSVGIGQKRNGCASPEILFANADTDDKLVAFVRKFGPVVAECAYHNFERPEPNLPEPRFPPRLFAVQDLQELRNEQLIFRSAIALAKQLTNQQYDSERLIGEIAARIVDWPRQWEREKAQSGREPLWNLDAKSLKRIESLKSGAPDLLLPPELAGRIVICELLNAFRPMAFANPLEMHSSIKSGIRPLLYSIVRRHLFWPRDVGSCANARCKNFFNIERTGQKFCSAECSLQQRQRVYWAKRGKKLRKKRIKRRGSN